MSPSRARTSRAIASPYLVRGRSCSSITAEGSRAMPSIHADRFREPATPVTVDATRRDGAIEFHWEHAVTCGNQGEDMDAIALLKADHDKVKELLTKLGDTTERAVKTR